MRYLILLLSLLITCPTTAMELKATVNDTPISDLDIKNWARLLKMQQPDVYDYMPEKQLNQKALDSLIESTVKNQTATTAGLRVSEKDVQDALSHLEQQNGLKPGELPTFLKRNGVSEKTMREQVTTDLLWLQYLRQRAGNLNISDLAVEKRY